MSHSSSSFLPSLSPAASSLFHLYEVVSSAENQKIKVNRSLVWFLVVLGLTLKAPITTAADDIHKYFFIVFQRQ